MLDDPTSTSLCALTTRRRDLLVIKIADCQMYVYSRSVARRATVTWPLVRFHVFFDAVRSAVCYCGSLISKRSSIRKYIQKEVMNCQWWNGKVNFYLATSTKADSTLRPVFAEVSMKFTLYSRASLSPSSRPTARSSLSHLLPLRRTQCWSINFWNTVDVHSM